MPTPTTQTAATRTTTSTTTVTEGILIHLVWKMIEFYWSIGSIKHLIAKVQTKYFGSFMYAHIYGSVRSTLCAFSLSLNLLNFSQIFSMASNENVSKESNARNYLPIFRFTCLYYLDLHLNFILNDNAPNI